MKTFQSAAHLFRDRVEQTPELEAFSYPKKDGSWGRLSWRQVAERVDRISAGLLALGIEDEQRVGILCSTRVEWLLADIGVMVAGAATTTIYPSTTAEDCAFIINDSDCRIIVAEDDDQVGKLAGCRDEMPQVAHVVVIDGSPSADGWVLSLNQLEEKGEAWNEEHPGGLDEVLERITPDRLCTLIYTSGTTGRPKGVELLHDCWLYVGEAIVESGFISPDDRQFLWLPLSHSFGKMLEMIVIAIGVPTAVDGTIPKIIDNLAVVRPTFMAAAPRIFEKAYNKIVNGARQAGGVKLEIFRWAVGVGKEASKVMQAGEQPSGLLGLKYRVADRLVFSKVRERFGGRLRFMISGSAPLNRDIAEFFHACGMLIIEGYGLTESSAASVVNRPNDNRFGTVGQPLPGTEIRLAENGEILLKSRGIMRGYHNLPEVNAETLSDGWLHTGDKGEVDDDGKLRITDRIKNLIKTSGGKYVAPQHLEGSYKAVCPYVSQIVVHGDKRNYCTALITMDEEAITAWAEDNGLGELSYAELADNDEVRALFQDALDTLNADLARYETIKKFALLPEDFSVDNELLTPSLKVKRKKVEQTYMDVLDGFYEDAMAQV